jgi:hypothetical protein
LKYGVIDYVAEEVRRQGHDVSALDGITRVGWMLNAWAWTLAQACPQSGPVLKDAIMLGQMIEPRKNLNGLRQVRVRIGSRIFPDWEEVPLKLAFLFEQKDNLTPLEFYKEFELIHPFVDGNGRTGKILFNWKNSTLLSPIFPPHDLFGDWIGNP